MAFPPANPKSIPIANQKTRRAHRGEVFWQILLPLFGGVFGGGFLIYLLLAGGSGSIERGAQIAIILLALPTLLLGFALLALLLVLNGGMVKLLGWLPPQAARIQHAAEKVNVRTGVTASAIMRAFMKVDSWGTAARKVFKRNR
jgi:hypothetical protein